MSLLEKELTVIVTTSPSPMCPSTELIEAVLDSLVQHAPDVSACRLIVVCDGAKVGKKQVFRSGHVNEASWTAYVEYKERLRERIRLNAFRFPQAEVLELASHHGFGFAVYAALQLVRTRLVCVVQHDRVLLRPVALAELCESIIALSDAVGYVLLPTRATADYPTRMHNKLTERGLRASESSIEAHAVAMASGVRLLPCLTFYDSTHICRTAYYRDKIFPCADETSGAFADPSARAYLQSLPAEQKVKALVFASCARLVTKGAFLEAELAPRQLEDVARSGSIAAFLKSWKTWLYDDGISTPLVGHLNGAVALPWAAVQARYGGVESSAGQRWQRDLQTTGACEDAHGHTSQEQTFAYKSNASLD